MEIKQMIEALNEREDIAGFTLDNLENSGLTEAEKSFMMAQRPERALIVYGTLAPGRPNYPIVENIKGEWREGVVRGKLISEGWGAELGYNGFSHCHLSEQQEIEAHILLSDELLVHWDRLDRFEGEGYRRILAPYETRDGGGGVGYIYALNGKDLVYHQQSSL